MADRDRHDSRDLADLHPHIRSLAERLLAAAATAGVPLTVTFTTRSLARQAALYAQGRGAQGPIVTDATAGYSFHNYGLAFDVVPTELLALPHWGDTPGHQVRTDQLWATIGAIGEGLGLRWAAGSNALIGRILNGRAGSASPGFAAANSRRCLPRKPPIKKRKSAMNIKLLNLIRILGRIIAVAPAIVAAVKPVLNSGQAQPAEPAPGDNVGPARSDTTRPVRDS